MSGRALPDLVARLRLERGEFATGVAGTIKDVAGLDVAVKGASKTVGTLEIAHRTAGLGAKAHAAEIGHLESAIKDTDKVVGIFERTLGSLGVAKETGIGRAAQQLSGSTGGLGAAGAAVGIGLGGLAAGAGVLALLDNLASKQQDVAVKTLNASAALGVNTTHYQELIKWGERFGITQDTMDTALVRFSKNVGEGAPLLKKQGVDLEQLGITSHNTYEAYLQAADAISKMTDSQQRAIAVNALFGRGGEQQIEALQAGRKAIEDYTAKLERFGVILDHDQLATAAFAKTAKEDLGLALQGLENQFVAPLEKGFALLEIVMTRSAANGKSGFQQLGQVIGTVIGDIASFLNGLFNLGITQKDIDDIMVQNNKTLGGTKAALGGATGGAIDYTKQIDAIRDKTTQQTRALAEEVKGLEAAKSAYDKVTEAKIRDEQATIKEYDEEIRLIDLRRQTDRNADKVKKDQAALNRAVFVGDFNTQQTLSETLANDEQQQQDDLTKATINAHKDEAQARIDGLNEARRVKDDYYTTQVKQIQDTSTDLQQQSAEAIARLQDQAKAAGGVGKAYENGITTGIAAGNVKVSSAGVLLSKKFEEWGDEFRGAFTGDKKKQAKLLADVTSLGTALGKAIGSAMLTEIRKDLGPPNPIEDAKSLWAWLKGDTKGPNDITAKGLANQATLGLIPGLHDDPTPGPGAATSGADPSTSPGGGEKDSDRGVHILVNIPNYIGTHDDLRRAMGDAAAETLGRMLTQR